MSDAKGDQPSKPGRDVPSWIEPDRVPALLLLKVSVRIDEGKNMSTKLPYVWLWQY